MSYAFDPSKRYRMPTHFGPAPGPRNVPEDIHIDHTLYPKTTAVTVKFLTDAQVLSDMLPPGFTLAGDPVVSLDFAYMDEIQWLAGRGYNICLVSWPTTYNGKQDTVTGRFAAVLFESAADPIITGRDELGHPKVYCEIPPPMVLEDKWTCRLSWDGCEFLRVDVSDLGKPAPSLSSAESAGWIQYKYIPGTPLDAGPDCAYATLSPDPLDPAVHKNMTVLSQSFGDAKISTPAVTWHDMPTVYHIANGIASMPIHKVVSASVSKVQGWIGDVGDTQRLI